MLFLGVKECKVLLYILWEVIGNMVKTCQKKPQCAQILSEVEIALKYLLFYNTTELY